MLFRKSISNTKKFFQRTLQSFKSFLSGGYYERLPKTPPCNPFSCGGGAGVDMNIYSSFRDLDMFYTDFTDRWDADKDEAKRRSKKKPISTATKQENEAYNGSFTKFAKASPVKNNQIKREEESCSKGVRELRGCLVAQKIKELEMMDVSNVEHVLDIEEVLHYYSRLTCPAYLDIVDKFFLDMYSEFLAPHQVSSTHGNNSRLRLRSVQF